MKFAFLLAAGLAVSAALPAYAESCLINDPSAQSVNVRSEPDGEILGRLPNGTPVQSDLSSIGSWVYISWDKPLIDNAYSGWVYRSFLICNQ